MALVSATTHTPEKDEACIIERGEHPWLTRRSCISYVHAKVATLEILLDRKDKGSIVLQESLSQSLLARIRRAAGDSTTLPLAVADILVEQEIIRLTD